ncbi:MAG: rhomboid family intramembrane serine protease [Chloroherpetonaceae bacterium]|nr:rhomboid family intramembrane serine protease [Chthonomonadaceae bacterium]MDW8207458.1 rhomboid family intramembrane serine protease [Chloroherpetonaceae bacterium]
MKGIRLLSEPLYLLEKTRARWLASSLAPHGAPPGALTSEPDDTGPVSENDPDPVSSRAVPPPIVTYLLLGIITVLFLWMWSAGNGDPARVAREFGAKDNDLIRTGQYWRLITPIFLHGSELHLLTNALSLYWFGGQLERFYGWRKYLILWLLGGIMGNGVSYLRTPEISIGASGALFGLLGAGLIFPIRFRALIHERARQAVLTQLLFVAAANLGLGFVVPHIDNWNHMGGMVGGALCALVLVPDALEDREPGRFQQAIVTLLAVLALATTGWAAWAQWQWAGTLAPVAVKTYGPAREHPWWTVQVPAHWQYDGRTGYWRGPDGITLRIVDSVGNPDQFSQAVSRAAVGAHAGERSVTSVLVDGKEAQQVVSRSSLRVQETYLIPADGGQLAVVLTRPVALPEKTARDIGRILGSIRIIRPVLMEGQGQRGPWPVLLQ